MEIKAFNRMKSQIKVSLKNLVLSGLLSFGIPVLAADAVNNFQIYQPEKIIAGQMFEIQISALRVDGTLLETAKLNVNVTASSSAKSISTKVAIRNGKGTADLTLDNPGLYILQIVDAKNPNLTGSGILKVESAEFEKLLKGKQK